jgi:hypothetical protein
MQTSVRQGGLDKSKMIRTAFDKNKATFSGSDTEIILNRVVDFFWSDKNA